MKILQIFAWGVGVHLAAFLAIFASPGCQSGPRTMPTPDATVPAEAPPAGPGRVTLSGDAVSATLRGSGGTFGPGEVPVGSYTADVSFGDGTTLSLRSVSVEADRTTQLRCSKAFQNCKVIKD